MKPTTFKYFVAVEDYKIIGTDVIVNKGDFIVMLPDRLLAYSPVDFIKYMDIIPPVYKVKRECFTCKHDGTGNIECASCTFPSLLNWEECSHEVPQTC
jgi:hypothetical protein